MDEEPGAAETRGWEVNEVLECSDFRRGIFDAKARRGTKETKRKSLSRGCQIDVAEHPCFKFKEATGETPVIREI
jgi:hypothetical protein